MDTSTQFKALVVVKTDDGRFVREIRERRIDDLPGDLLCGSTTPHSTTRMLSLQRAPGVTRLFPHTPQNSTSGVFAAGDKVIVTGYDLGMETDGGWGFTDPVKRAVRLPAELTEREVDGTGTAGTTAALSVLKLDRPALSRRTAISFTGQQGELALLVAILARAGYRVVAYREQSDEMLFASSGRRIITRDRQARSAR